MNRGDLVSRVGAELFARASEHAWATAERTGRGGREEYWRRRAMEDDELFGVRSDLAAAVWYAPESPKERVQLAMDLYREMPCSQLLNLEWYYPDLDEGARELLWGEVRQIISHDDDRLADPMLYELWCGVFEDAVVVRDVWPALARPDDLTSRGIERLLGISGPVPWVLKSILYEQLIGDRRWHEAIDLAIYCSVFDLHGDVAPDAALAMCARLDLPPEAEGVEYLRQRLLEMRRLGVTRNVWRRGEVPSE